MQDRVMAEFCGDSFSLLSTRHYIMVCRYVGYPHNVITLSALDIRLLLTRFALPSPAPPWTISHIRCFSEQVSVLDGNPFVQPFSPFASSSFPKLLLLSFSLNDFSTGSRAIMYLVVPTERIFNLARELKVRINEIIPWE